MILAELRRETSIEKAHESPKMYVIKKNIGEQALHKLLCFILKDFQDSLKITTPENEMSASEIFSAADILMGTGPYEYGYESVFDVLMAFKHYKSNPYAVFNKFSDADLRTIMKNYLTAKADFLERHNSQAARDALKKDPLSLEQINREYELSKAGLPTNGDRINEERRIQDLKKPENWHKDEAYRKLLAQRNWSKGYPVEDVDHEVINITDEDPTQYGA